MNQTELDNLITTLKCCYTALAGELAINLFKGDCDISQDLILLSGYIESIEVYDLNNEDNNCITEEAFYSLVSKAKNICKTCNCNN